MPAPTTGRELLDLLQRSQLLDAELFADLRGKVARHEGADPVRLAKTLVRNLLITEYQAKQLLAGRYKGFYIGKYKLLEVIGAGGMGKVFLAEQVTMERLVAIKILSMLKQRKGREKEILARFAREAKAVAALRHNNIIHAYDFDQENGLPYIVMEFVEGLDTAALVGKQGLPSVGQAADIIKQAASGLEHAHQAGLVHRDVKPGNLLIDASGTVKILDLGLCSALDQQRDDTLTVDQDQLGTVDFIAPEQALDSHKVDGRADIYSLGATFYGLLSGRPLYPGKSTAQKLLLHQTTMPQPIGELRKDIPDEVIKIIETMLAKDRDARFASMAAVEQALEPFAQPQRPPFPESALRLRRDSYEPLLSKSPEPAQINVASLGKPDSSVTKKPNETGSTATSMIGVGGSSTDQFADLSFSGEVTELALPLPRVVKRRKKGKGNRRGRSGGLPQWVVLSGLVGGGLLVLLLSFVFLLPDAQSASKPEPTDQRGSNATEHSTHAAWSRYNEQLRDDPSLLAHYTFSQPWGSDRMVPNQARDTRGFELSIINAHAGDGRWPLKSALQLKGVGSGEYAALNSTASKQVDFQSSTSVAVWFRVDSFTTEWQAILGKGDHSWRLHRNAKSNSLCVAMNKQVAGNPKLRPSHNQHLQRLDGRRNVNDGKWHLATIVFDMTPQGEGVLKLFVDGTLDSQRPIERPWSGIDPVWIGANSSPDFREHNKLREFHGAIDEVAIWNRALSEKEVLEQYQAGVP